MFSTFVRAVQRMALGDWPGFAAGGALWFPDLRQACRVVYSPDALPAAAGAGKGPAAGCQCLIQCQCWRSRRPSFFSLCQLSLCQLVVIAWHEVRQWRPACPVCIGTLCLRPASPSSYPVS